MNVPAKNKKVRNIIRTLNWREIAQNLQITEQAAILIPFWK